VFHNIVYYKWNGKTISVSPQIFCSSWSGIILLIEPTGSAIEPDYKNNRKKEIRLNFQIGVLIIMICTILVFMYVTNFLYNNINFTLEIIINFIGIFTTILLLYRQLNVSNNFANKICSILKQGDCKNILESKASKIFGISWSEIGFSYFISNIFILLFMPQLFPFLVVINICILPYTLWSVWYQKKVTKQWCPLCLIVLALLWCIFIVNSIFNPIRLPVITMNHIILLACIYFIPLFSINLFVNILNKGNVEDITHELNSIKSNDKVFMTLLKQQPYYEIDKSASKIIFGNPHAPILVTILTNPHCHPCANMHKRIENYIKMGNNNLCVQYIFTSFKYNNRLEYSSKFLIAAYLNLDMELTRKIYEEWFDGKESFFYSNIDMNIDSFLKLYSAWFIDIQNKYNVTEIIQPDIEDQNSKEEFSEQQKWVNKVNIQGTPTIFINGYLLPENYKIEDLKYFDNLDLKQN
jgi:uncharacterized membrane protein/thiol-disulfide isomerase/thioredoxin